MVKDGPKVTLSTGQHLPIACDYRTK